MGYAVCVYVLCLQELCVHVYDHERRKDKDLSFVYSLAQNKDILLGSTSVCMDSVFAHVKYVLTPVISDNGLMESRYNMVLL